MNETHTPFTWIPNPEPKPDPVVVLEGSLLGKTQSGSRVIVSIERRSTRLLDPDNLYGSVKPLVDCLRAAKLIADDDSQSIELVVTQSRVKTRKEHETIVTLDYETQTYNTKT
jgi:hypothetical protein